jgi:hypothetical protein
MQLTPEEIMELGLLSESLMLRDKIKAARTKGCPAHILQKLAKDRDYMVRSEVALNTTTPVTILEELSKDRDRDVQYQVIRNPNTPLKIIVKMTQSEIKRLRTDIGSVRNLRAIYQRLNKPKYLLAVIYTIIDINDLQRAYWDVNVLPEE